MGDFRKLVICFVIFVFLFVLVAGAYNLIDYLSNKDGCNAKDGYYTNGQCVTGPVVVTP